MVGSEANVAALAESAAEKYLWLIHGERCTSRVVYIFVAYQAPSTDAPSAFLSQLSHSIVG